LFIARADSFLVPHVSLTPWLSAYVWLLRASANFSAYRRTSASTAGASRFLEDGSQVVEGVIWIHPDRSSGEPCFAKTRVPIQNLFDYLESGAPLEEFLTCVLYNADGACHAKAITVGNTINPDCDTYLVSAAHAGNVRIVAGVGACKVTGCQFNQDFECTAESIKVGFASDQIRCLTFQSK
jgi:hypothetical protein